MNTHQAIYANMDMTDFVMKSYLKDLSDADLMTRPGPGCNHLAWQLGHLINSEQGILNMLIPGSGMALPEGFGDKHNKTQTDNNDPKHFYTKEEYISLYKKSRENVKATLAKLTDADFDKPSPKGWEMFPSVGAMANLLASHAMMHAGQFAVVRRALGKPIVI
ncbi:MAG TPA: DinB family protein [Gemmatales bacterium]|nr:DinB family protein [Gemmatales bacterium]